MPTLSNVSDVPDSSDMTKSIKLIIDIMIIIAVTGLGYYLEGLLFAQGWIPFAEEARGASSVIAGAFTVVGIVLARGGSLADLGFRRPQRWAIVPYQAAGILLAFIAAQTLAPLLISLFIAVPAPDLSRYDSIAGNLTAAIGMALVLPLTASIPEEIIYRGFLVERLSAIFGRDFKGATIAIFLQSLLFGAIHYQWGIGGMLMTVIMGIVWGCAYLLCGRNLWVVIIAHSAGHILLVVQLYLGEAIIV